MPAIHSDQSVITTFAESLADATNGHTTVTFGSVVVMANGTQDRAMMNGAQEYSPMKNGTQDVYWSPMKNGAICIGID